MRLQLPSRLPSTIFSVLFANFMVQSIPGAHATALTTYLTANERSCFYADVDSTYQLRWIRSFRSFCLWLIVLVISQVSGRKSAFTSQYSPEDPLILTTWYKIQTRRYYWKDRRSDREITSSLRILWVAFSLLKNSAMLQQLTPIVLPILGWRILLLFRK